MYAVIRSASKQYSVKEGQHLKLEKLEVAPGEIISFDQVLLIVGSTVKVGTPLVEGAKVTAQVIYHGRGGKVTIIKFHRRKHYLKRQCHRQWFTTVKITGITSSG